MIKVGETYKIDFKELKQYDNMYRCFRSEYKEIVEVKGIYQIDFIEIKTGKTSTLNMVRVDDVDNNDVGIPSGCLVPTFRLEKLKRIL